MNARLAAIFTGPALAGLVLLSLLDAAAKGAVILLLAAIAALVMRRASAASRHHVWLCALAFVLVLPIASWMLPQWRVLPGWMRWEELPKRLMAAPAAQTASASMATTATTPNAPVIDESSAAVLPPAPSDPATPYPKSRLPDKPFRLDARWLLGVWAFGSVVLLLPLALSAFALGRKCRRTQIVNDGALAEAAARAQRDLGFRQRVRVLLGERDAMPMVWGVFRPCLLLPADAVEWTQPRLRAVLLHELAHLRRRDPLWQLVAHCGLALHWFNPLAWFAVRRLRIEQERACDDFVLRAGIRASEYAADMLAIVGSLRPAPFSAAALTMANLARLEGRITGILDGARNRRALTGWIAAAAAIVAAAIVFPLAMLRAADEKKNSQGAGEPSVPEIPNVTGIVTTSDSAEIFVDEKRGGITFVIGEGAQPRLVVHEFGSATGKIVFRVSGDDRQGRWWDQALVVCQSEGEALFPELPENWLPRGRVIFLPTPAKRIDGAVVFAEIELASEKVPLAVRAASRRDIENGRSREIPRTSPESEINLDCRIYALSASAPAKTVILPAMAAQDLTGPPRGALCFPYITLRAGMPGTYDRMGGRAEEVKVTATMEGSRVHVAGKAVMRLVDGKYASAADALRQTAVFLKDDTSAVPGKRLEAEFSATLGSNDALVVPIASGGLFPETLVASMTALPRRLSRVRWQPPDARPPIQLDGWVLTWPRAEQAWFASNFDYPKLLIETHIKMRRDTSGNGITSEAVGTLEEGEVERLLAGFHQRPGVAAERVEPFFAKQNTSGFPAAEDRTHFSAAGEGASVLPRVDERHISLNLKWDAPVLPHMSASDPYGLHSGTSLCMLLPGPAEPEKIRLLVLRCVDPSASVQTARAPEKKADAPPATAAPPAAEKPAEPKGANAKIEPASLLGFWKGSVNGEAINISFHRPPADADIQCDIYFGEATIGALMTSTIAPDGKSVTLMGRGEGGGEYARLTPGEEGTLQLELTGKQSKPGKHVLTHEAEAPSDEPRQAEPATLFAAWKKSAYADGKIPGALIGKLAEEVKAYVKANPTLDSGMKLPKLLPRFDASRNWTPAEVISLLDDVAYYAIEPIKAVLSRSLRDALWRTKTRFEIIPVQIANWSEAKDGLRIGMRVSEGDWRVGGKVRLELWLHNAGAKDAAFNANPGRADFGLSIAAKDAEGNDHWAKGGSISNIAIPLHCTLPAGFVAQVKDFELSFEEAWVGPKFRDLKPGKYKLRCVWSDPQPTTAIKGDWIGTLTTPELDFTLAGSDTAAVREAKAKAAAAEPAGKLSVANRTGKHDLGSGRSLYICKPEEEQQWFSVFWPATAQAPKCSVKILPNVAKGAKWAVVFEPGGEVLWWADDTDVGKLRLTDPANVLVNREGRENNFSRDFGLTDDVKEEFRKLGFVIGRDKTPGRELLIGGNTGGQTILSAQTQEEWSVEGTVTDADGKPLANVPITVRSEYRPTVDLATAITDAQGRYGVVFSLDLETLEKFRGIEVRPALAGFTERELANNGAFNALLFAGEQPQRMPPSNPRIDEEFKAGPIPRFGARDLVAAQPARADFVMLPAGEIVGRIVTTEGAPLPNYFISLAAPQQLAGYSVASASSDERGQFRLAGVPTNQPLIFRTNPGGNPSATIKSAPEKFETAKIANVRIIMPPQESGASLTIERTEGRSDAGAAAAESEKTPAAADAASGTRPGPGSVLTMRGYMPGVGESRELIEHCHAIAAAHGRPQATGAELVAWGDETRGLRAGLLMAPRAELGVPSPAWIVIRNVSKETMRVPLVLSWNTTPVVARDTDGKPIAVSNPQLFGTDAILQCLLEPGEQVDMKMQLVQFGGEKNKGAVSRVEMGIGKCEVNIDLSRADRRPTPEVADLGRFKTLATGRAVVEVTPAKPAPRRVGFTDGSDLGSSAAENRSVAEAAVVKSRLELDRAEATLARLEKLRSENSVSSQEVDEARMKLEVLKADLAGDKTAAARARLAHAESELKRVVELSGQKLISQQEVDERRMRVEVLKAELVGDKTAAARARLAHAESELKRAMELSDQKLISQQEVDERRMRVEVLKAEMVGDEPAAARARLAHAEAELKRVTELHSQKLISSEELDRARAAVEMRKAEAMGDQAAFALAQLAQAEAQLKRVAALRKQKLVAEAEYESAKMAVEVARAEIEAAKSRPEPRPGEGSVVVEIHADGTIHIGTKTLSLAELEKHLAELRREDPALAVTLAAAKAVDYTSVTAVLNVLKTAGISNATLQAGPSAADNAPAPQQKWMAAGRVTDKYGVPMEGVLISVDAGMGSLFQTGKATTGANGRYTVEFTQGVMMEKDSPGLQFANLTARKPHFFEKNLNRHGAGAMALREVAADDLKGYGVAADALALPGRARTVDFVMLPAARIKGRLLGTGKFQNLTPAEVRNDPKRFAGFTELNRSPLAGWQLWLKGKALPPGASVICPTRTDKDGNFVMEDVPTGYEWQFLGETNRRETNLRDVPEALSRDFFKLRNAADYTITVELPEAQDRLALKIQAAEGSLSRGETPEFSNPE